MLASALLPIALSDLESIKEKLKKACEVVDSLLFVALVSETAVEIQVWLGNGLSFHLSGLSF